MENNDIVIFDTENMIPPKVGNDLYASRINYANNLTNGSGPLVSIVVQGYNRVDKTKVCVEAILKYTTNIDYELILVDNGSTDGTFDYFRSVECKNKKIIKITKNIGAFYPLTKYMKLYSGKYIAGISNDIIVTKNWLDNILKCYEADNRIGYVMPMSTNVTNLQEVPNEFSNLDEMQSFAEKFNKHNPDKWEQRMRLVAVISVFKREILDIVGTYDFGFFHDFSEDDHCLRIRRAGYKLVLCGDTFIHHNHDFRNLEDKDEEQFNKSLEIGRQNFKDKYLGLDAWDDVNNFELNLIGMLKNKTPFENPKILGIDVRMGSPILEIKNKLRKKRITECICNAFTTQAKYFTDLQTVCDGNVVCDRIDYMMEYYLPETFDYCILGESINTYPTPLKVLQKLLAITKSGGYLLVKLRNTNDIRKALLTMGLFNNTDPSMPNDISRDDFVNFLNMLSVHSFEILQECSVLEPDVDEFIKNSLKNIGNENEIETILTNLSTNEYLFCVKK
ncbi:MAG: glycosyltransferase family 2 protein [Acetobacterium woodii]|nr:glycosyltransferase family 2 protein [Acetobacterium woodii]